MLHNMELQIFCAKLGHFGIIVGAITSAAVGETTVPRRPHNAHCGTARKHGEREKRSGATIDNAYECAHKRFVQVLISCTSGGCSIVVADRRIVDCAHKRQLGALNRIRQSAASTADCMQLDEQSRDGHARRTRACGHARAGTRDGHARWARAPHELT